MDVQIDVTHTVIETPRLLLRGWKETDLDDLFEYASVEGVGELAGWKHHESREETEFVLKMFLAEKNVFAIEEKESGKVIGSLGLHDSWANRDPAFERFKVKEIGYVLSKAYWGRGIMPEAVNAVMGYCFDTLKLDALTAGHFTDNAQSRRVIEKCGFTFVKEGEYVAKALCQTFPERLYVFMKQ